MDEVKEKDVSVDTVVESCEVAANEHLGSGEGEKNTVVELVFSEVKANDGIEGSLPGEGVIQEGGSCNVVDTVVGVSGSDINIDGVCLGGDGCRGNSSTEAASSQGGSNEEGLEGYAKGLDSKSGVVGDSSSQGIMDLGAETLNLGIEQDAGGSAVEECKEEEEKIVEDGMRDGENDSGGGGRAIDHGALEEVGNVSVDSQIVEDGNGVEGSMIEETQVVVKEVVLDKREGSLSGELVKVCVESGVVNVIEDSDSQEIVVGNEIQDQRVENVVGNYSVTIASSSGEVQVATVVTEKSELVGDAKKPEGTGGGVLSNTETHKFGVLHDEVTTSGIETTVATSSTILEDSTVETQVAKGEPVMKVNNEGLHPGVEASDSDAFYRTPGTDASSGRDSGLEEKCEDTNAMPESFGEQTQLEEMDTDACEGNAAPVDETETTCPNIEGMDADAFDENFCFSVEELQGTDEAANWSTENHYDAFADSQSSCPPPQVATEKVIEGDKQVTDSEHTDLRKDQAAEQQMKDQTVNGSTEYGKDEVEIDHKILSGPLVSDDVVMDGTPYTSQNVQCLKSETLSGENLRAGEENEEEQKSRAETLSISTTSDNQFRDGGETDEASNDELLRCKTELKGLNEGDQQEKVEEDLDNSIAHDVSGVVSNVGQEMMVQEDVDAELVGLSEGQEMEVEELDTDNEQENNTDDNSVKRAGLRSGSSAKVYQASYQLPPDDEGEFSVSDLVWGKVRSHPWWPGQIFDPSDASEKAMKYHKKDCFLVAYFGDRTFAWNEASLLKPFRSHFSQVEKQSNLEVFQNAVDCALEEVSRRVELGLACSCISKDVLEKIRIQIVENTGIQKESSTIEDVDKSMGADLLEPERLVEYMKALAQSPAGGADRLELVIAKSQLLAFYRLKGYSDLPEFQFFGGLLDRTDTLNFEDEGTEHDLPAFNKDGQLLSAQEYSQTQRSSYHKRKHNLMGGIYPSKKERSMSELMGDPWESVDDEIGSDGKALVSPSSGRKRKGSDIFADEPAVPEGRKTISLAKVSTTTASFPKPSFKIGECIRRVASQMTGSPSILKSNNQKQDGGNDGPVGDGSDVSFQYSEDAEMKRTIIPPEYSSLEELLSQLHLAARDPLKGYSFFNIIVSFFSDFRNSVVMEQHDKRRKASIGGSPETFEFEDMSDTYWTDRVIQNGSEEQPPRKSRKKDNLFVPVDLSKPFRKSNSKKQYSDGNFDQSVEKPAGYVDEKTPAELVMHFPVVDSVPSEISLNKMFRCFGPLKESETEVDRNTNRARVVFKRCADAESAYGSAPKFNIFGSTVVNYQLNYTISVPFKTVSVVMTQGMEDATLFLEY